MADINSSDKKLTSRLQETPIAIIGMASLFPESRDLHEFWENIMGKVDCIIDVPSDRWEINDLYDADPSTPDKTYSKRGGFIPDIDFDPMEFGLPPNILEVTDSSQLLSLVVARDLLKDCGYVDGDFDRENTGVILGVGGGQKLITPLVSRLQGPVWEKVLRSSGVAEDDIQILIEKMKKAYIPWVENSFPGMLGNVIAGRVANRFDLGGTNCVVDAACAGSLAAMKMAISDLLEFKANTMITGGVDTDNSPFMYLNFSKTPAFTSDEVPKPFDEGSHGIVIGEGVGMMMLKRLEDAERDNDRIYAVIKGVGTSSDGRFKSIYAPRASGQSVAIDRAYEDAGFDKSSIKLLEAHGTGTKAGDAAEFNGLKLAFDTEGHEKQHIALGSVKSQIGHTKTAAGSAGLIKTALALYHKVLPPTINLDNPNPKLEIEESSFYLNTDTRPWINNEPTPRRAGVSSFGFGGSNYHFVLEEYQSDADQNGDKGYRTHEVSRAFLLHANTPDALTAKCQSWLAALQKDESGQAYFDFVNEAETGDVPAADARLGFVAVDQTAVVKRLTAASDQLNSAKDQEAWTLPSGIHYRKEALPKDAKVVALFSGQGSQYINMCKDLTINFPPMRESFAKMGKLLLDDNDTVLSSAVFPEKVFDAEGKKAQKARLNLTQYIQPSIGSVSAGLFKMMQQSGFKADIVAGHSYGELTALWAAGVIDDEGFYSLSRARAVAMGTSPEAGYDAGAMLAVMGDAQAIEKKIETIDGVAIANYNSPTQVVVAGASDAISAAAEALKAGGYQVVALPVSAAFHSPLVSYADKPFSAAIEKQSFKKPHTTIFSNVTAKPYPKTAKDIKQSFKSNMLNSVKFTQEINAIADQGGTIFVEFGPKNVLTRLVGSILQDRPHLAIALNSSPKGNSDTRYRDAMVQLKVAGVELELKDSYQRDVEAPVIKKAGMNIKLNGGNYVSDATKKAFEDTLNDGFQLTLPQKPGSQQPVAPAPVQAAQPAVKEAAAPVEKVVEVIQPVAATNQGQNQSEWLQAQNATMSAHETYLLNQQDYSQGFFNMMHHLVDEFGSKDRAVPENISQNISDLHQYQQDTLRVHQSYLQGQIEFNRASNQFITGSTAGSYQPAAVAAPTPVAAVQTPAPIAVQPTTVASAPVVAEVAPAPVAPAVIQTPVLDAKQIQQGMLEIVQDKTGYPIEMLDLNMNMEADLGIDSIKRVEILGAMTSKFPELPELDQNTLAEMQTLLEIVEYVEEKAGSAAPADVVPVAVVTSGLDLATIEKGMLEIVHDKTGYPVEMLDLNMNMEADLGIDSIKRVEILGAMTNKFPELPELDQNALAEMQTLLEIVEYVEEKAGSAAPVAAAATSGLDLATIEKGMLEIVHDKTGYPVEMLDLNMNMEADLGIDSIKRVEILGAMTSKFPELPELDQNALAEMQTLLEIVEYVEQQSGATASATPVAATVSTGLDSAGIQKGMLEIVHDKTGYPVEMLDLNMNMEADLGIDSIKRVEILGAMTSKFPELPELDQNALAEMQTLLEIVQHVEEQAGAVAPTAAAPIAAVPASSGLDSAAIQKGMLEIVHDKTGYPVEMLDLNMNMEADLGIDSIKRVEILGAMTSKFPELPELDQNALSEMQTLLEIVQHVEEVSGAGEASAEVETISASSVLDEAAIQQSMLEIVHEKTGYPVEMLDLNMNLEADLGIDSIKRVEILGAMTSKFPELPELDQNALSEMGTLAEIVTYVKSLVPQDSSISRALSEQTDVVGTASNDVAFSTTESVVVKKRLPRPDILESEISVAGRSCLITDNGEKVTTNLAKSLLDMGWNVTVLQFPTSLVAKAARLPKGVQSVKLAAATDAELEKTLSAVTSAQTLNGFIHLSSKPADAGSTINFSENEKIMLKLVFFSAKYLQKALTSKPAQGRNFFVTTSYMDGEIGTAGKNAFELSQGGLNGLVKSVNLEWDDVFCRAIDLSPDIEDKLGAQLLINELFDPDLSIVEVGLSDNGRMTLVGEVRAYTPPETANNKISEQSLFFVSGGAKGVTAACVMQLAEEYKCRFILAGRAAYNGSEPAWANGISDDTELKRKIMEALKAEGEKPTPVIVNQRLRAIKSDREISKTLAQIESLGGQAEYISADITNSAALKERVAPAVAKLGKITGLVHGAGILADKPIEKKSESDFDSVLNTKIDGLAAILSLVDLRELEYLALFSSAAGFYGNNGQSDYSVANEILNKTAYQVRNLHPNCHVISFNWGPWDGGMVTPELKRYFQQRNVEIIPIHEGAEIFSNELNQARSGTVQLLVGSSMRSDVDNSNTPLRTFQINTSLLLEDNPFLSDHVIGGNPVLPSATALSWMASICERISPSYSFFECDNFQVLKGIVFDKAQADAYQVDVNGLSNDDNVSRFQVTISSKNSAGKPVWHYKADILVAKKLPAGPIYTESDLSETESTSGEDLYENGTLFHGSLFQGIEKVVNTSMDKLTLLCNLDKIKDDLQGQFPISSINPFATDLMFQAMLVWVRKHRHLGSLPLKFLKVVNYKLIPDDKEFYISLDVDSTSETNMTADVTIHDKMGQIYSKAIGAEVTVSPSLNSLFSTK